MEAAYLLPSRCSVRASWDIYTMVGLPYTHTSSWCSLGMNPLAVTSEVRFDWMSLVSDVKNEVHSWSECALNLVLPKVNFKREEVLANTFQIKMGANNVEKHLSKCSHFSLAQDMTIRPRWQFYYIHWLMHR